MDWPKLESFVTTMVTKLIAVIVLMTVLSLLVALGDDSIALIAILSGIAGSAATFLFAPRSNKE